MVPNASLMTTTKFEALQKRAPKPCPRRVQGAPTYAMEEGAPCMGADLDATPPEMPTSRGLEPGDVLFFLGATSGGFSLLLSGSSTAAA